MRDSRPATEAYDPPTNRNRLWIQAPLFVLFALLALRVVGPGKSIAVLAGLCVFVDAWISGIWGRRDATLDARLPPVLWALAVVWVPLLAMPVYALGRGRLKQRDDTSAFFALSLVFGGAAMLLSAYALWLLLARLG